MPLRSLRTKIAVLFAGIVIALAIWPLLTWRSSVAEAVDTGREQWVTDQMEQLLVVVMTGGEEQVTDFPAWWVNGLDGGSSSFQPDPIVGIPLGKWMSEAGDEAGFRTVRLDNDEEYLGYVRPIVDGFGYVTVVWTGDRDDELASIHLRTVLLVGGLVLVALGAGWLVAGLALAPARRAMQDQQGFLADAAHEMRTPLAVILASSSQALSRARTGEEYVRSLSEIRSAAERAGAGVNELLDLVRFDSGQAIPRRAPLRVDLLAEEVAASVRPEHGTVTATPGESAVVDADMALLRQALDNLVRNAVRRAATVELRTSVERGEAVIEVADDGPGFDPAMVTKVFDRYARGDRRGEAGMGLAIVKAIVVAHGGSIEAENRATGGALVRIRLPLSRLGGR